MTCYSIYDKYRKVIGHICGELGEHCSDCGDLGSNLCDYPVGEGKTCDRLMCDYHAKDVAPNIQYCEHHYHEWRKFKESGGIADHLKNVIAFKDA